jgi:hypothetical protein
MAYKDFDINSNYSQQIETTFELPKECFKYMILMQKELSLTTLP